MNDFEGMLNSMFFPKYNRSEYTMNEERIKEFQQICYINEAGVRLLDAAVKNKTIEKVEAEYSWRDDHEDCIGIALTIDEKTYRLSFWWMTQRFVASMYHWDESPKAKANLYEYLRETIDDRLAEFAYSDDEFGPYDPDGDKELKEVILQEG